MDQNRYKLEITFTCPILGSQPGSDTPAAEYLKSKVAKDRPDLDLTDETGTLPEELQKGTTGFRRDKKGKPILMNYQIKGLIKECAQVMNEMDGIRALRSKIDNLVMVSPRQIPIVMPDGGKITILERPLRAMTAQGPRTSLARSEQIPEGSYVKCELMVIESPKVKIQEKHLRDLLDYGCFKGLGQWRNSGSYGMFEYVLTPLKK